jgi:hypothetical protein
MDILFPLSLWPFLHLLARHAGQRRWVAVFASGFLVFDVIETIATLIAALPERIDALAANLPAATIVKRVCSLLAFVIPLSLLGFQRFKSRPA